ncbi:MAG: hypothetical protein K8S98_14690 [Planctomycetes bacterium]|nr:hypothetical protein [Planctomycetota bacterium]
MDSDNKQPSANVAAVLTWLVPGAGHLYLGRVVWAVLGFALIEGLFYLGLMLSDGRAFEYLDPELRSNFAPALSPEVGNLGAFLYQLDHYKFGPGVMRAWPEWMRVGSTLCAVAGILNVFWAALAHMHARSARLQPRAAVAPARDLFLTWLVPGAGHWAQGRKRRGVIVFVLLVGLFALGTWLAEGSNLSRERHFYFWAGQFLVGAPAIAAEAVWGAMRVRRDIPYVDCGLVFGCVAGMLNVLAMIDAFGYAEAKAFGWPTKSSETAESDEVAAVVKT